MRQMQRPLVWFFLLFALLQAILIQIYGPVDRDGPGCLFVAYIYIMFATIFFNALRSKK